MNKDVDFPREMRTETYVITAPVHQDQIQLREIWGTLKKQKISIVLGVLVGLAVSAYSVFTTQAIFQSEVLLLPPLQQDIQDLLVEETDTQNLTPGQKQESVYQEFQRNLHSYRVRQDFLTSSELNKQNIDFDSNLKIQNNNGDTPSVKIIFQYTDPVAVAEILNGLVNFVDSYTVKQLHANVQDSIRLRIQRKRNKLNRERTLAKQRRQDRIIRLEEELSIAKELNIRNSSALPSATTNPIPEISVTTVGSPHYIRGTKALQAEIDALKSRKSDDPLSASISA